ncbi:MAG: glycosyltransferase family 2 protein [Phycisphaerales bacterium]|nr:glycosyltransferase family 2 protein [Phycisphaerales bacterium]
MSDGIRISVIVPTYEEAGNIAELVQRIDASLDVEHEIILVDDDSQDGTPEVVEGLGLAHVRLLVRKDERGLSGAVLRGLAEARGQTLVVMDADLSHPPEAIVQMQAAISDGADFVVGSRYVPGGSTEDGWGFLRWVNSMVATVIARPFTTVRDPMSGFFAMPRSVWTDATDLDPVGYKIALELMVKCGCTDVREVPIHFSTRRHGESKLSLRVQLEFLLHIVKLMRWKFPGWSSLVPFALVGLSGMGVYVGLLSAAGAIWPDASTLPKAIGAALVTIVWNFLLDRRFAFWYARSGSVFGQFLGFLAICAIPVTINILATVWLAEDTMVTPLAAAVGSLIGSAAGLLFNWLMSRWLIFGRKTPGKVNKAKREVSAKSSCKGD